MLEVDLFIDFALADHTLFGLLNWLFWLYLCLLFDRRVQLDGAWLMRL
jgi:hypothetical protein